MILEQLKNLFLNDAYVAWLFFLIPNAYAYSMFKKHDLWNQVDDDSLTIPGLVRSKNSSDAMSAAYHTASSVVRHGVATFAFIVSAVGYLITSCWVHTGRYFMSVWVEFSNYKPIDFSGIITGFEFGAYLSILIYFIGYFFLMDSRWKYKADVFFGFMLFMFIFGLHLDVNVLTNSMSYEIFKK